MESAMRCTLLTVAWLLGTIVQGIAQRPAPNSAVRCPHPGSNEVPALENAERDCLARLPSVATRAGASLHLKLRDGTTKTFISDYKACQEGDAEKCLQYWLRAYLPAHQAVLVAADAYESGRVMLVNLRSGNVTILEDEPHFSPSGQRFVVVKASESEEVENDVAIYTARSDPPALEFAFKATEGTYALYSFVKWDGESRIRLKVYTREKAGTDPKDFDAQALRTGRDWRIDGPAPGP
jgi:hypothetical protein